MEPIGIFANVEFWRDYGNRAETILSSFGKRAVRLVLPEDGPLPEPELGAIEIATFNGYWEVDERFTRRFFGVLLRAPRLAWFHAPNAGVDHPVFARLLERGVYLTTSAGANAQPVAHSVLGGMLALARGFPHWWQAQQRREWSKLGEQRPDLAGQTVVLVGLGAIGQEVARLLQPFGLTVIGVRQRLQPLPFVNEVVPYEEIDRVLPWAHWLVLCCPLTEKTQGLVSARRLALLPDGARLINVSRGAVVDEEALIAQLRSGKLAGAYLDVFCEEPLPPSSPLWSLPNVIISPHDAAGALGNRARVSELFLDNLERFLRGAPMRNLVGSRAKEA